MKTAELMMNLFDGLRRSYGEYTILEAKGLKQVGKAVTKKGSVTAELWKKHLDGKQGIGIVPIRDDSTAVFGAIDIDSYDGFDPTELSRTIAGNEWPFIVCRSKSGGAHVYAFFSEPISSRILRSKLRQFSIAIGHPKAEIFPKQDFMMGANDTGNWINMPYFNAENTDRPAYDNGEPLTLAQFIKTAQNKRISLKELEALTISSTEFSDAPPCLERLVMEGFPSGTMNNGLFNMAVYARMKFPDDWQRVVYDFNDRFMGPGTPQEVQQIIKSVDKKKYTYKCSEAPICGVCDKRICSTRKFSPVGEHSSYKTGAMMKTARHCILDEVETPVTCFMPADTSDDEPYWVFKIHGHYVDVSVDMVQSQQKFIRFYLKKFQRVLLAVDEFRWAKKMNEILETAVTEMLAPDAGPEGQLFIHLENFCNGKAQARVQEELLLGKPYRSEDRVFFRSQDLVKYLEINRFKEFSERQLYSIFRRHGAKHHKLMLKGKCVACWSIPQFEEVDVVMETAPVNKGDF